MPSTFHGLQTAYKGLMSQQTALKTTGHNIANANTEGYARQRVNFSASQAFPASGKNAPAIPGQIGTGTDVESIQRIRDHFIDVQFREASANTGYWETRFASMTRMEDVLNEQSETGRLVEAMDEFSGALQDLSANPDDASAREVTVQRAAGLADTYNYMIDRLETIQRELGDEIDASVDTVNQLLTHVHDLNEEISRLEVQGQVPNDLYDERDRIVDDLSEYLEIEIAHEDPGEHAHPAAEGEISLYVLDSDGHRLGTDGGEAIVQGGDEDRGYLELEIDKDSEESTVIGINFGDEIEVLGHHNGSLGALVDAFGYGEGEGSFPEMLDRLEELVGAFQTEFNDVHQAGVDLNGDQGMDVFMFDDTGMLSVNEQIMDDTTLIAAAQSDSAGDGSNALKLAHVKDTSGFVSEYQSAIGEMAVQVEEANRMNDISGLRRNTIKMNRQSVSSVSLDEEMTNMIQFQHAYNASSRMITVIDEMLEQVINQMGVVGR